MIAARWYWVGLLGSGALLAIAYFYFQLELGLPPCPLCMFQRACLVGVAFFCLLGLIFKPKKIGSKLLAFGGLVSSATGLAIAGRQVWLQNLPADQVPECGPDLEFMLEAFPLMQTIETVLSGSGECAEIQWQLLGLSMPAWMVLVFSVMVIICLKLLFIKERNYFSGALGR
ncbi:disulfide bond formation protein B [Arenicella chitinivorans]|uniref:disulfide bond formation protein B n=1 Tax=Arenicella chitinivorans TaxID=1329800 RepID=UPI001E2DC831|nr:disulfide bond formation protein B [Arenicella chitinivorans]